jgi:3-deoxy-D-manno-octulosonate 8-phosphate phosphatase (KDO 8-P phosphatase)
MNFNCGIDKAAEAARKIRLLALDVDGILTDGRLYYSNNGEELKAFHALDGHGIKRLQENKIEVAIITGRTSNILKQRASELRVAKVHQGVADKLSVLNLMMERHSYSTDEVAYAGDDLPDLNALQAVGLSFSVPNAHPKVKKVVDIVTNMQGGWGAVREMSDFILKSKGNCQTA